MAVAASVSKTVDVTVRAEDTDVGVVAGAEGVVALRQGVALQHELAFAGSTCSNHDFAALEIGKFVDTGVGAG